MLPTIFCAAAPSASRISVIQRALPAYSYLKKKRFHAISCLSLSHSVSHLVELSAAVLLISVIVSP